MDHSRYLAYRSVTRALDRMPEWQLDAHERERLRDTAEALLLTSDADEAERLRRDAAVALSILVGQRRCDDARADALWDEISDCGPRHALSPSRRGTRPDVRGRPGTRCTLGLRATPAFEKENSRSAPCQA